MLTRRLVESEYPSRSTKANDSDFIRSKDDTEYDHRMFSIHQVERQSRDQMTGKKSTNDIWLHSGGVAPSNVPSRMASPEVPGMDAGAEMQELESQGVGSQVPSCIPRVPLLDNIQAHLGGIDMSLTSPQSGPVPISDFDPFNTANNLNGSGGSWSTAAIDNDTRRWMNLDYGFDFQPQTLSQNDMLVQDIDQAAFEDFSRFLEQAGTSNSDTELFPW